MTLVESVRVCIYVHSLLRIPLALATPMPLGKACAPLPTVTPPFRAHPQHGHHATPRCAPSPHSTGNEQTRPSGTPYGFPSENTPIDTSPLAPAGHDSQSLRWFAMAFAAERALDFPLASITLVPLGTGGSRFTGQDDVH